MVSIFPIVFKKKQLAIAFVKISSVMKPVENRRFVYSSLVSVSKTIKGFFSLSLLFKERSIFIELE
jgi:hypothetical protein